MLFAAQDLPRNLLVNNLGREGRSKKVRHLFICLLSEGKDCRLSKGEGKKGLLVRDAFFIHLSSFSMIGSAFH